MGLSRIGRLNSAVLLSCCLPCLSTCKTPTAPSLDQGDTSALHGAESDGHAQRPWTIQRNPDTDTPAWTQEIDPAVLAPDFPRLKGETGAMKLSPMMSSVTVWGPREDQEFSLWKALFDEVPSCEAREKKRGRPFSSVEECLSAATAAERPTMAAQQVYHDIQKLLNGPRGSFHRREMRGLMDTSGRLQCVALTHKVPDLRKYGARYPKVFGGKIKQIPALEIAYLLTAPWNLNKEDPRRVHGAGTGCVALAVVESSRGPWRGRITLEAAPSAVPFYLKLGFIAIDEWFDPDYGLGPMMWLTKDEARKLIPVNL